MSHPDHLTGDVASLDAIDMRLIELLRADGRMSNRALSSIVGLKEAAVAARLRSLTERQLLAVSTLIDWERAGYSWDLWIYLDVEGRPIQEVASDLAGFDSLASVQMVFGAADLVVHALAVDRPSAAEFLAHELAQVKGIRNVRSSVALETIKFDVQFASLPLEPTRLRLPNPVIDVDEFDETILLAFMKDARQSIRQIARDLGVSDSTIRLRLARLEEAGLIRMCAQVDPNRTRLLRAWAYVGISVTGVDKRHVCEQLAAIPEVIVVSLVTGSYDIIVLAASSRRQTMLDVVISQIREVPGIYRTVTSDIIQTAKLDFRWARLQAQSQGLAETAVAGVATG